MARRQWGKPKPANWAGVPVFPTAFCIFPIWDSVFSPELMVFLVYNHADKGIKNPLATLAEPIIAPPKGKPAGYGMPGGGVNPDHMEGRREAAEREGGHESGIRVIKTRMIPIPGRKNKALIFNKKTDEFIRHVSYADGQQESILLQPGEELRRLNPLYYYLAEIDWANSKVREFFLNLKNDLIAEGCPEEAIAQFGLSANDLTREELLELGVDPEEVSEIGGFALLPISFLRMMKEVDTFYLNPDESRENEFNPTSYVYYSHVMRIMEGLEIMGVA